MPRANGFGLTASAAGDSGGGGGGGGGVYGGGGGAVETIDAHEGTVDEGMVFGGSGGGGSGRGQTTVNPGKRGGNGRVVVSFTCP